MESRLTVTRGKQVKAYRSIEVNRNHVIKVYADYGKTYWCALKRYNPQTKGYDVVTAARADDKGHIDATVKTLACKVSVTL